MSSPPSEPGRPPRLEGWRRLMLAGAVLLLAVAVGRAVVGPSFPEAATLAASVVGYALLAAGFARRMRDRG